MKLLQLIVSCSLLYVTVTGSTELLNTDFMPTGKCRETFPENQTFTRAEVFDKINRNMGTNHASLEDFDLLVVSFIHLACRDGHDECTFNSSVQPGNFGPLLTYICCKLDIETLLCPEIDLEIQTFHLVGTTQSDLVNQIAPVDRSIFGCNTTGKIFNVLEVFNNTVQELLLPGGTNTFNRRLSEDQSSSFTQVSATNDIIFDVPCPRTIFRQNDAERCQYVQSTFRFAFFGDELPDDYCRSLGKTQLKQSLQDQSDQHALSSSATVRILDVGILCGPTTDDDSGLTPTEKLLIVVFSLSAVYVSVGCCQIDPCYLIGSSSNGAFLIRILNRFFWGYMLRYPMKVVTNNSSHEIKLFYRNLPDASNGESEIGVSNEKSYLAGFAKLKVRLGRREREVDSPKKPHKKIIRRGKADDMFVRDNAQITVARHVVDYDGPLNDEPQPMDGHLVLLYRHKVHISKKYVDLGRTNKTGIRSLELDIEREGGEKRFIPDDDTDAGWKRFMQELSAPERKEMS